MFRLGDQLSLPAAATPAVVGMKEGGRRRILIPPSLGWVNNQVGPRPDTFGGTRRLVGHRDEPLLLEVELLNAKPAEGDDQVSAHSFHHTFLRGMCILLRVQMNLYFAISGC